MFSINYSAWINFFAKFTLQIAYPAALPRLNQVGLQSSRSILAVANQFVFVANQIVVAYSTIPWRKYPHERGKKMRPKSGEPSGREYAIYSASEHAARRQAYCCLSRII
jgi:hypothetical protein